MKIEDASWGVLADYAIYVTNVVTNSEDQPYPFDVWYDRVATSAYLL